MLEETMTATVVPLRHEGYPRFLGAAWPYYSDAISTGVGLYIFTALWLPADGKEERQKGKDVKTE
jgi:oligosaccharyltransferase complex subunit beta